VRRGDRLYGRGSADDKAGVVAHVGALQATDDDLPLDVSVLIEGEEEVGSPGLGSLLAAHPDLAEADVLIATDGYNHRVGHPSLAISTRGCVNVLVEIRTHAHAVHSGLYGGAFPDALMALARLVSALHDDHGRVTVPGLGAPPSTARGACGAPDAARLRAELGAVDGLELIGDGDVAARLWDGPAISVLGIDAPRTADAANQLVPCARAVLSARLAPGLPAADATAALVAHIEHCAPWGAKLRVRPLLGLESFRQDPSTWAFEQAQAAVTEAWGEPAALIGEGGSLPVAAWAARRTELTTVLLGVADPASRAHGPDESVDLTALARTMTAEAHLLERLATRGPR
jgi:acetylornithine deacetylase/succinyl-diaminopimelate desuccinylase-like protein